MLLVANKDGFIRLVVDGRQSSVFCHRPPNCSLVAAAALGQWDLPPEALALEGITAEMTELLGAGAEEAFTDCFGVQFV